jgi:alpha-glucosidase
VSPWLPMADPAPCNVADQEGDPDSVLELCRRAIAARHASEDLAVGSYRSLPSPDGTWAYARGDGATVLLNMSGGDPTFDGVTGTVTVSTEPHLEGSGLEGALTLPPWSGAVVTR